MAMIVRSRTIISWVRTALTMTARRPGRRAVMTVVSSCVSCADSVRSLRADATEGVIASLHIKTIVFVCAWESRECVTLSQQRSFRFEVF